MPKPRVHQIDPSDGNPLDFVRINADGTEVEYSDASALGIESIVEGTGITVDDTDPANPIVSATGGGGSSIKDPRWTALSGQTSIDEFNDASLDAAWVRIDSASGGTADPAKVTYTEKGDSLSINNAGDTSNVIHGLVRPLSGVGGSLAVGDGFVSFCMWQGHTNTSFDGLLLTDGTTYNSGKQVICTLLLGSSVPGIVQTEAWTSFGTRAAQGGNTFTAYSPMGYWLRLSMISTGTYRGDVSLDGISWFTTGTVTPSGGITPTHVGFHTGWTGTHHIAAYDCIRRVSGVT